MSAMAGLSFAFHITNGTDQVLYSVRLQICMHTATAYKMCWIGSVWDAKYKFTVMEYYHSELWRMEPGVYHHIYLSFPICETFLEHFIFSDFLEAKRP
jgi:hypothetical protein